MYKSGNTATQIDFILFRRTMRKLVTDVKVNPGEEVALQHQLLVCNKRINESKCRKDQDHDLWYGPGPPAEFRRVSMRRLSHWSGQQQHFCNSCKHWVHKKCSGLKGLTKDPDYSCTQCQGTARPLDSRPQREVCRTRQAGGGSFLLLPRRHALSRRWL